MSLSLSPEAAENLIDLIEGGMTMFDDDADRAAGATDCPMGCTTEPDAYCRHGFLSAQETMIRTVM